MPRSRTRHPAVYSPQASFGTLPAAPGPSTPGTAPSVLPVWSENSIDRTYPWNPLIIRPPGVSIFIESSLDLTHGAQSGGIRMGRSSDISIPNERAGSRRRAGRRGRAALSFSADSSEGFQGVVRGRMTALRPMQTRAVAAGSGRDRLVPRRTPRNASRDRVRLGPFHAFDSRSAHRRREETEERGSRAPAARPCHTARA